MLEIDLNYVEALKAAATRLFQNPRLSFIFKTFLLGEKIENIVLSDEDRFDLMSTFTLSRDYRKTCASIENSVTSHDMTILSISANDNLEQIFRNETLSLKEKIQANKAKDYFAVNRVYQVSGTLKSDKKPKNILFLNSKPACYMFNDKIHELLHNLYELECYEYIIISAPAIDARRILATGQIDGILDCLQAGEQPRKLETLLDIFNTEPFEGTKFDDTEFNDYVMSLPMHWDLCSFVDALRLGRKTKQVEVLVEV